MVRALKTECLVAYARCLKDSSTRCYVPRVDDAPHTMRLLHISQPASFSFGTCLYTRSADSVDELAPNAMGLLEPADSYASGKPRENGVRRLQLTQLCWLSRAACDGDEPLDVIIVPGVAFDTAGRRRV